MRHIRTKGRPSDPNREYVFDPCLCRIALLKRIPADPVDGTCSAEKTGSKSPTARSSIVLSPSAVRIVVPFRKQLGPGGGPGGPGGGPGGPGGGPGGPGGGPGGPGGGPGGPAAAGVVFIKPAKIADAAMAPMFMRLRRDLWIPFGGFSRPIMFRSPHPGANSYIVHGGDIIGSVG